MAAGFTAAKHAAVSQREAASTHTNTSSWQREGMTSVGDRAEGGCGQLCQQFGWVLSFVGGLVGVGLGGVGLGGVGWPGEMYDTRVYVSTY